jgi:hypothetical protein
MYGRPVDLSLLTRKTEDETFVEWTKRFASKMGRNPDTPDIIRAPFAKFKMAPCKTQEKFRWCIANYGLSGFHETIVFNSRYEAKEKIWLFNDDNDAAMFKLRWFNEKEDEEYVFDPRSDKFAL